MTTTVLGVPELLLKFLRMEAAGLVATDAAQARLADDVAELARQAVPVDTGVLQESIETDGERVFTDVAYAGFVEYGTSSTPAQPFMRPAADTVNPEASELVAKAIMDAAI